MRHAAASLNNGFVQIYPFGLGRASWIFACGLLKARSVVLRSF